MDITFLIFGSKKSTDIDVIVLFKRSEYPTTLNESRKRAEEYKQLLHQYHFSDVDKDLLDVNLGLLENNHLVHVMKGNADETNNSIFFTRQYHEQKCTEEIVLEKVDRNVEIKMRRVVRYLYNILNSIQEREKKIEGRILLRQTNKDGCDFQLFLKILRQLNFCQLLPNAPENKRIKCLKHLKGCAFQIGQLLSLYEGVELYQKSEISEKYPSLKPFLNRNENYDLTKLNDLKNLLINETLNRYKDITIYKIPNWQEQRDLV